MHALLMLIFGGQALGQLGEPAPRTVSPVGFVAALSHKPDDTSPPLLLYVYRFAPSTDDRPRPTAAEVATVVRELLASADWQADGAYLKTVNNRLVVRHRLDIQRRVTKLLVELGAIDSPDSPWSGGGGFGCGCTQSVIPIVGQRTTDRAGPPGKR